MKNDYFKQQQSMRVKQSGLFDRAIAFHISRFFLSQFADKLLAFRTAAALLSTFVNIQSAYVELKLPLESLSFLNLNFSYCLIFNDKNKQYKVNFEYFF